jgi:transposase
MPNILYENIDVIITEKPLILWVFREFLGLIFIQFWRDLWYNINMKTTDENIKKDKNLTEYTKEELINECLALRSQVQESNVKMDWLMEQIRLGNQKRFGSSTEKTEQEQVSLFDEAEKEADLKAEEPSFEEVTYKRKKSVGKRETDLAGLEVETVEYQLSEEEQSCSSCGESLHVMSKEVRREIKVIPAQFKVVEHVKYIYSCRNCEKNDIAVPIIKAPGKEPVIKGSIASPSLIANIMNLKYVNAVPLYRQEQEFSRYGVNLSRQTMANWMIRSANDWLDPVYQAMKHILQQQAVLYADETVLQVLKEPGRKANTNSYMWLYRTGRDVQPIVLFEYQTTRSASHPKAFLKDFKGYLHSDGYQGYHNLQQDITVVGCMAHTRRYYDESLKSMNKEERATSNSKVGLDYCNQLFKIERDLADMTNEDRYEKRLKLSQPVLDAFLAWAQKMEPITLPKSAFGKAIHYTLAQWSYLKNYVVDGRLELSNNRAERSIKSFVIGRSYVLI